MQLSNLPLAIGAGETLSGLPWIDQVGLGLIGLFFVLGLIRGLWWQVFRLVGLSAAILLARLLAPLWSPLLEDVFSTDKEGVLAYGIMWVAVFILTLIIVAMIGKLGKKSLDAMKLGLVDRIGGGVAGVVTGLALHSALLFGMASFAPADWSTETLDGSRSAHVLKFALGLIDQDSESEEGEKRGLSESLKDLFLKLEPQGAGGPDEAPEESPHQVR